MKTLQASGFLRVMLEIAFKHNSLLSWFLESYYFQDEFGLRPNSKAEFDKAVQNAKSMEAMMKRVLGTRYRDEEWEAALVLP